MKQIYIITTILFISFFKINGQTIADYNLLIVNGYNSSLVKTELETLGHIVTIESSANLTSSYDYSSHDVIIFMYTSIEPSGISEILSLNANNQLGIILMRSENLINSCDIGSAVYWSATDFTIEDNSHFITQPFSLGVLDLGFTYKSNLTAINSGNTILGSVSAGNGSLVVNDTYRRVISPYYGHTDGMPWTSIAGILMDRIIAWVASSAPLSINEHQSFENIKIFPNPSSEYITVSGLENEENYSIYNITGSELKSGIISENDLIDIQNLTNGLYFLKFEKGNTLKFIKD